MPKKKECNSVRAPRHAQRTAETSAATNAYPCEPFPAKEFYRKEQRERALVAENSWGRNLNCKGLRTMRGNLLAKVHGALRNFLENCDDIGDLIGLFWKASRHALTYLRIID